ncbi:ATP-binding cassette sub-family F member 2 [Plecturocebus cupreus]
MLRRLGVAPATWRKKLRDFSGAWRMRGALARALFIQPFMVLQTSSPATWTWMLARVCEDAAAAGGEQVERLRWEPAQTAHMKSCTVSSAHGSAKPARQAQGKEKTLQKTTASGLTERVMGNETLLFYFPPCGKIPPPVITVHM